MFRLSARISVFALTPFILPLVCVLTLACECAPPPPPCEAVGQVPLVFLGTVTEVDAKSTVTTARMHDDHAYKGTLKDSVALFDNRMCDGPLLETGRQYLMYRSGSPDQPLPARGCTRSRRVESAAEDLEFLKNIALVRQLHT